MQIELTRFESGPQGTFGRIGQWFTLERQWLDNRSMVSCIPEGSYRVYRAFSPHLRRVTYRLAGTAPRQGILIHPANLSRQLQGCIALGEKLGFIDGVKAILLSSPAVHQFEAVMPPEFTLQITGG